MAQVTVIVNNRNYTLACDDGEEEHLSRLAAQIDNRIGELPIETGAPSNEARLILMSGLVVADELAFANERIVELEQEIAALRGEPIPATPRSEQNGRAMPKLTKIDEEKFAGILESAARRMEDIAARLA